MTTLKNDHTTDKQSTRFLSTGIAVLALLQIAILAVLFLREQGGEGAEATGSSPNCIREFGFNPKAPRNPDRDCRPAPVNITERA